MALTSATAKSGPYTGDAATHIYAYAFRIRAAADLEVVVADTASPKVETTLTYLTDYTISGVGNASGGNVTLVNASQAWLTSGELKTGYKIIARRKRARTQTRDIRNQNSYFPETHEDVFDEIVMMIQELNEQLSRVFKFQKVTAQSEFDMPEPSASKILAWNSAATALELVSRSALATGTSQQGNDAISLAASTVVVTFTTAFADTSYSIAGSVLNTTDSSPMFQDFVITAKATTGFTASFNAPMDSANYTLSWVAFKGN